MTTDEMEIAIATKCGWSICPETKYWMDPQGFRHGSYRPPAYASDLNMMFQADSIASKKLMDADQWEQYGRELDRVHPSASVLCSDGVDYYDLASVVTGLTAAQRAKAFCRVFWPERFKHK